MRFAVFLLVLSSCSAKPISPMQADLPARQACMKELTSPSIQSAEDFLELGKRKVRESETAPDALTRGNHLRCAIAAYEAATAADPRNPEPEVAAADFYFDQRSNDAAAFHYRRALDLDPAVPRANLRLGLIARNAGNPERAQEYFELEAREHPGESAAYFELGNLALSDKQFEDALGYFDDAYRRDRANAEALFNRALAKHLLGRYALALADFRLVCRLSRVPRPDAYWQIGLIHEKTGRPKDAVIAYRRFLELVGNTDPRQRRLAEEKLSKLTGK